MTFRGARLVGLMNSRNRPKASTAEDVHGHLVQAIVDQRLAPGAKLTEFALVEAFGVGRRHVAAALARLGWERLVVSVAHRGFFVASPDRREASDIFAARAVVEGGATAIVAEAGDPAALARLSENLATERRLRETGRLREAIHLSGGFHVLMAELSGNAILVEQVRLLVARTSLVIRLYGNDDGLAGWHAHHDDLVRLCRERRPAEAARCMREHIAELADSLVRDEPRALPPDMLDVFGTERP